MSGRLGRKNHARANFLVDTLKPFPHDVHTNQGRDDMTKAKRHTAPEVIASVLGWDMRDVSDGRYQSTRFNSPGVYVCGDDYYCAPSGSQKPPRGDDGWKWQEAGEWRGRTVYRAQA